MEAFAIITNTNIRSLVETFHFMLAALPVICESLHCLWKGRLGSVILSCSTSLTVIAPAEIQVKWYDGYYPATHWQNLNLNLSLANSQPPSPVLVVVLLLLPFYVNTTMKADTQSSASFVLDCCDSVTSLTRARVVGHRHCAQCLLSVNSSQSVVSNCLGIRLLSL